MFAAYILIGIASFLFMEFFAWFLHKYVMHGFMWGWHKDHHIPHNKTLEKNDRFVVVFALPGIGLLLAGIYLNNAFLIAAGVGISFYGIAYFLFHDVYVHQRIKLPIKGNTYLRATKAAHLDHHQPHAESNFGFLLAPRKYYKRESKP